MYTDVRPSEELGKDIPLVAWADTRPASLVIVSQLYVGDTKTRHISDRWKYRKSPKVASFTQLNFKCSQVVLLSGNNCQKVSNLDSEMLN